MAPFFAPFCAPFFFILAFFSSFSQAEQFVVSPCKDLQEFCTQKGFKYHKIVKRNGESCVVDCTVIMVPMHHKEVKRGDVSCSVDDTSPVISQSLVRGVSGGVLKPIILGLEPSDDRPSDDRIEEEMRDLLAEGRKHKHGQYALETIQQIRTLYRERTAIAAIGDSHARERRITELTGLFVEDGFCVGSTQSERESNLMDKVNLLLTTYRTAKAKQGLVDFFVTAFDSPPCFNGRISHLTEYAAQLNGLGEDSLEFEKIPIRIKTKYLEIFSNLVEKKKYKLSKDSTLQAFMDALQKSDMMKHKREYLPEITSYVDFEQVFNEEIKPEIFSSH